MLTRMSSKIAHIGSLNKFRLTSVGFPPPSKMCIRKKRWKRSLVRECYFNAVGLNFLYHVECFIIEYCYSIKIKTD
uniref:Uncharacterized protein n=1 Tax=Anguilla anguilla TaxID=7936 RepID=A0A0E9T2K8_ANGAN